MDDDAIIRGETRCDLSLLAGLESDFDPRALSAVLDDPVYGPLLPVAKEGARWDLKKIPTFPHHDPDLDPIGVAEGGAR